MNTNTEAYVEKWGQWMPLEELAAKVKTWTDVSEMETQLACAQNWIDEHTMTSCESCKAQGVDPSMHTFAANLQYLIGTYRNPQRHLWTTAFLQNELQSKSQALANTSSALEQLKNKNFIRSWTADENAKYLADRTSVYETLQVEIADITYWLQYRGALA